MSLKYRSFSINISYCFSTLLLLLLLSRFSFLTYVLFTIELAFEWKTIPSAVWLVPSHHRFFFLCSFRRFLKWNVRTSVCATNKFKRCLYHSYFIKLSVDRSALTGPIVDGLLYFDDIIGSRDMKTNWMPQKPQQKSQSVERLSADQQGVKIWASSLPLPHPQ